jgi:hypothetical protein
MRPPSLFVTALLVLPVGAFVFFGFLYYPTVLNYIGFILVLAVFYGIIRANATAFTFTKNEVASGIYEIHMDSNETDFHVFTYHNSTRIKSGLSPLRIVQHYFFRESGERFYNELFSHDIRAKKGAAGYEGFETFEKSVLPSNELRESLITFSGKAGKTLGIGRKLEFDHEENLYPIEKGLAIRIEKDEKGILTRFSVLFMNSYTEDVLWRKKI